MRRHARLICGSILLFFALLFFVGGDELPLTLLFVATALILLYREILIGATLIIPVVRRLGTLLHKRAQKIEQQKHCACCGAIPVYMVTTCTNTTYTGIAPQALTFLICQEHHPNPKIGTKAHELHALIDKIHPEITIERIYPHNPYAY